MLAVGLRELKALDVRGIAPELVREEIVIETDVPHVHAETHITVDLVQRRNPFLDQRNDEDGFRHKTGLESLKRTRVGALGHPVVARREEPASVGALRQHPALGLLDPGDPAEPASPEYRHRVGRKRGLEVEAGPNLDDFDASPSYQGSLP